MRLAPRPLAVLALVPVVALSACGGSSGSGGSAGASPTAASTASSKTGVTVAGAPDAKPTLTVPTGPAPTELSSEVLRPGDGATVAKGDLLVANYLGQTWAPKDGKPNVFDNSWDRGQLAGFPIGVGKVIQGWDQTLVGQKVGSRVLLSIPPALAYGTEKGGQSGLGGETLLFVVDIKGAVKPDAAASGTAVTPSTPGLPKVDSKPGTKPVVTSVAGVKAPTAPVSGVLVQGDGPAIDAGKSLALQIVATDVATGKQVQETWGNAAELVPAAQVFQAAPALKGQKVGSRVVAVEPASQGGQAAILVIDVVGQF